MCDEETESHTWSLFTQVSCHYTRTTEGSTSNNNMFISNSTEPDETETVNVFMEEVTSLLYLK